MRALLIATLLTALGQPFTRSSRCLPQEGSAREQLERAAALRNSARGLAGAARARARQAAVRAYRAVVESFPHEPAVAAEAAFRAGELLRAGGDGTGAREEFARARSLGAGTDFRARAALELGHLARRDGELEAALDHYLAVLADHQAGRSRRDDAALWAGRVYALSGRRVDARRMWSRVAETAEDALDRVLAFDDLALSWIEDGDLEAAAGELERCREVLSEPALEETELGERVRRALQRMRAIPALKEAVLRRLEGVVIDAGGR
jgi:tetratricopeptide (TPR) repeat protein